MRTVNMDNIEKHLNQHLDHDYYQQNKYSSALEDLTFDNYNFNDLGGGLGFSHTTGVMFEL